MFKQTTEERGPSFLELPYELTGLDQELTAVGSPRGASTPVFIPLSSTLSSALLSSLQTVRAKTVSHGTDSISVAHFVTRGCSQ